MFVRLKNFFSNCFYMVVMFVVGCLSKSLRLFIKIKKLDPNSNPDQLKTEKFYSDIASVFGPKYCRPTNKLLEALFFSKKSKYFIDEDNIENSLSALNVLQSKLSRKYKLNFDTSALKVTDPAIVIYPEPLKEVVVELEVPEASPVNEFYKDLTVPITETDSITAEDKESFQKIDNAVELKAVMKPKSKRKFKKVVKKNEKKAKKPINKLTIKRKK